MANCETELLDLINPSEYITSADCVEGHAYWVSARSIGSVAVCGEVNEIGLGFKGLREKLNDYFLFVEYHFDDDNHHGTVKPFLDLGTVPEFNSDMEYKEWLLDQEMEVVRTRLDWLKNMPAKYKQQLLHELLTADNELFLRDMGRLKTEGFDDQRRITFQSIINRNVNSERS